MMNVLRFAPRTYHVALALLAASLVGCGGRSSSSVPSGGASGPPVEAFRPGSARRDASANLYLPGSRTAQRVKYQVIDGQAVLEGDILLGPADTVIARYGVPRFSLPQPLQPGVSTAVASNRPDHVWPGGVMPYEIHPSVSPSTVQDIQWAIGQVNGTELQLRPRSGADRDYVVFRSDGSGCSSFVGRIGGAQRIMLNGCARGSVIHEILHAAGFFHEQSRSDRDQFITINWNAISPGNQSAFEKRPSISQDIGAYDYGSIMHYGPAAFSRNGQATIIPKQAGVRIGQREGLSPLDRAGVSFLYGNGSSGPPPPSGPPPAGPPPAGPPPAGPPAGFAGTYDSERGRVQCGQNGPTVNCSYPGGSMICVPRGDSLDCGWTGGGQGRALFRRQAGGVLAGTYGDFFSNTSRGAWNLTPVGGAAPPPAPPSGPPPPAPPSGPPPSGPPASLTGTFSSTRGPMSCEQKGPALACSFNENGSQGRLDCYSDQTGLRFACTWAVFPPAIGSGRATFTRQSVADRQLSGSWGHLAADSGGGTWTVTPQ